MDNKKGIFAILGFVLATTFSVILTASLNGDTQESEPNIDQNNNNTSNTENNVSTITYKACSCEVLDDNNT